ncbi:uncharacterized protein TRUGW13939_09444, partial [Talaromyces rugulosus]
MNNKREYESDIADQRITKRTRLTEELLTQDNYTVGWICALPIELTAAKGMLDAIHPRIPQNNNDTNSYTLGRIGNHNVVITCGATGRASASTAAKDMLRSFCSIRFCLMVGIGGGVPSSKQDIRLGDVVVSHAESTHGGVIQYDRGKINNNGKFVRTGSLNKPPRILRNAVSDLQSSHLERDNAINKFVSKMLEDKPKLREKFQYPGAANDILFYATYDCESFNGDCSKCDVKRVVNRKLRNSLDPVVYYGLIGSADCVIKHGATRERLKKDNDILCFEMEAAGLMDDFPCLVIRGISDYSDAHKNDIWQGYAAATSAAYAKELLLDITPQKLSSSERAMDITKNLQEDISRLDQNLHHLLIEADTSKRQKILDWLSSVEDYASHSIAIEKQQPGTGSWFIMSLEFRTWLESEVGTLLCQGIPGSGKTVMASMVIKVLKEAQKSGDIACVFVYCEHNRRLQQTVKGILSSFLRQIAESFERIPPLLERIYAEFNITKSTPSVKEVEDAIIELSSHFGRVFFVLDGLDECSEKVQSKLVNSLQRLQREADISLLITCRPTGLSDYGFERCIRLEIRADPGDIELYINECLTCFPSFVKRNHGLQEKIKDHIMLVTDGMFLPATLHLNLLEHKRTELDVIKTLKELQDGSDALSRAYLMTMERIDSQNEDDRDWAHRIISWVVHAKRALTTVELQHALSVKLNQMDLQENCFPCIEELLTLCAGLVTLNRYNNTVQIVHFTTQKFFEYLQAMWIDCAHLEISKCCLTYLSFTPFTTGLCVNKDAFVARSNRYVFLDYAALYWGEHARGVQRQIEQFAQKFFDNTSLIASSVQAMHSSVKWSVETETRNWSGIHLATYFGLNFLLSNLLSRSPHDLATTVNTPDAKSQTLLWIAAFRDQGDTIALLLGQGADPNLQFKEGGNTFEIAIELNHVNVVKQLVEAKADVNIEGGYYGRPLFAAIACQREELVTYLLQAGADLNLGGGEYGNAFYAAAVGGNLEIVRRLLDNGTDVNLPGTGEYGSALQAA